jgi:fumarate hydratase class II
MKTRTETDSMGPVLVPEDALWGAQTQRAIENFPISGERFPRVFIEAIGLFKRGAAEFNRESGRLDEKIGGAIAAAATEVIEGRWDAHFPVDVFQTGSGTSFNMNANEVIANVAIEKLGGRRGSKTPVHPNDHVNLGQSSNDIFPSAAHLAALLALKRQLHPALDKLRLSLDRKAKEFDGVVKLGRTHLMDALPVRLGQEFGGYAAQIAKAAREIGRDAECLREMALGGTAVGTGMNAFPGYAESVCAKIAAWTGIPIREAEDHFEAQGARDDLVTASGGLKRLACALMKIANDIRWMGSGPAGGLGEILIPDLQPGSSIMPGKVNPVLCEVVTQVAAQAIGNDAAVAIGGQGGHFELNVMIPVMAVNVLESIRLLSNASSVFAEKCVDGIQANEKRCRELAEQSNMLVTALAPLLGYDRAAALAKEALQQRRSVRQLALEQGAITEEQARRVFDLRAMTGGGEREGDASRKAR